LTHSEGINSTITGLSEQEFIQIGFNLPGCGLESNKSGGTYDCRGPDSVAALKDITLFALGRLQDTSGKTLAELISPQLPLSGNVGIIGLSNGGNLSLSARPELTRISCKTWPGWLIVNLRSVTVCPAQKPAANTAFHERVAEGSSVKSLSLTGKLNCLFFIRLLCIQLQSGGES